MDSIVSRQPNYDSDEVVSDDLDHMDSPEYRYSFMTAFATNKPWPKQMVSDLPIEFVGGPLRRAFRLKPEIRLIKTTRGPPQVLVMKIYNNLPIEKIERFRQELEICSILKHKNIISYFGINTSVRNHNNATLNLVAEYCERGNVTTYLSRVKKRRSTADPLPEPDLLGLLAEVAEAIEYLHTPTPCKGGRVVVHGDIRPTKILITADIHAKLTSFRRSVTLEEITAQASVSFTRGSDNVRWRAPEGYDTDWESTEDSLGLPGDVYAWALTAASVLTEEVPFAKIDSYRLLLGLSSGHPFTDNALDTLDKFGVRQLLERSWSSKHENRPKISEIVTELKAIMASRCPSDL